GLGLIYSLVKKPIYTATTTFVLESGDGKSRLSQYAGVAAMIGIDLGGTSGLFQGENILELYRSRRMLERTLLSKVDPDSDELLIERYINFNNIKKDWKKRPELLSLSFRQDLSDLDSQT